MQFCQDHWDRLRAAIDERGMSELVAGDGKRAAVNVSRQVEEGKAALATFDPLLEANFAILSNVMRVLERQGGRGAVFYLMQGPDVPEEAVNPEHYPGADVADRTWPRCPLCYVGLAHELSCKGCALPKVDGFAWMIDKAADEQAERWEALKQADRGELDQLLDEGPPPAAEGGG